MASDKEANEALEQFANDIPGFIGASLVDLDSGMTLAVRSARSDFDLAIVRNVVGKHAKALAT